MGDDGRVSPHDPAAFERPDDLTAGLSAELLLRALPDGVWVFDDEGRTTYANDRMVELLGLEAHQVDGYPVFSAMDEQGALDFRMHLEQRQVSTEAGHDLEVLLHRPDATQLWALVSHCPVHDDAGERLGWVYRVKEHTRQRALMAELGHRNAQLAEAQTIARIGSFERNLVTGDVDWSAETYHLCGVDPATFAPTAETFFGLLHPDDLGVVQEAYLRMLDRGEPLDVESRLHRRGEGTAWLRIRAVVVHDREGRPIRIGGTLQDITAAKERGQGLEFLSALAGAANEAHDLGEVLVAFETYVRPLARWPASVVALPAPGGALDFLDIDYQGTAEAVASAQALTRRAVDERGIVHAAGPCGAVQVAGPVFVGDRLVCVIASDTLVRSAPDPADLAIFQQMLVMLAHVAERAWAAEEIAEARDEALQASRAKSDFLATMSHEIRTPLNGVIGLGELLRRTGLDASQQRLADGIDQAGRTLLALVNDILDLSKIEAGHLDLEQVDFDPRAVLEQNASLVADRARTQGLELVVSSAASMPTLVRGDPVRFGQVITNLVANAVKFTTSGEVAIRASGRRTPSGWQVRVEVRDTGIGIAPEHQGRLFDSFTQADSSTTRRFGGSGLGLSICRRIVTAMDGDIGVVSEPGAGSTFWFDVGLGEPVEEHSRQDLERENAVIGLRVLVVDDNATNRFILTEQLAAWGVDVTAVGSAHEAEQHLGLTADADSPHDPYDMVLLDYLMPGTDGLQLARSIRADEHHDLTRLVLASSAPDPHPDRLADAGIDAFLAKPVLPARLLDVLASLGGGLGHPHDLPARTDPDDPLLDRGRVLVVEDNDINQLVAEGVLRRLGYDVVLADNGAVAVAVLADEPEGFVAVLMDCQMPVMDGFDATRAMRAVQGEVRRTPIIAMTAAAVADERARCLEAGMDDFLAKPIDVGLLEATLARWVTGPGAATGPGAPEPTAASTSRQCPTSPVWQRLSELLEEDGIDPAQVARWVDRFRGRAPAMVLGLAEAVAESSMARVADEAHALRGSAANLGLVELADLCQRIEAGARDGRPATADTLATLDAAVHRADEELDGFARARLMAS